MICRNCGAEYDKGNISCPYCGTENVQTAGKQKREILKDYDREEARIRKEAEAFPQKTANKLTKAIIFVLGILIFAGVLISVIYILYGKLSVRISYRQEQIYLEKLEELYQEGRYEEMEEYCRKKELYGRTYQKYTQVIEINRCYERMEAGMDEIQSIAAESFSREEKEKLCDYWVKDVLSQAADILQKSREYADDRSFLGNEQTLEEFYTNCVKRLQEFGYTEEEIIAIEGVEGS